MDKKYLNSILLILLIVIWSSILYKHFGGKTDSGVHQKVTENSANYDYGYTILKDTFELQPTYKDPFGISIKSKKPKSIDKPIVKQKPTPKPIKKSIVWPTITYHGFVKGENNATRLILLKINNQLYRKREKETVNDITLLKSYNDSLIISLENNKKTIKKQ